MPIKRSPEQEKEIILHRPEKRPYGVKVKFQVVSGAVLGNIVELTFDLPTGVIMKIAPERQAPWEGGKNYVSTLEGFSTAAAAEAAGRQLVQALLWMSISFNFPLRLDYNSYEPAAVFERNRSLGLSCECYGEILNNPERVQCVIQEGYAELPPPDKNLLLSMEIFCASRLEASQRARFLMLVSALEPLANATSLGAEVSDFVDDCVSKLATYQKIAKPVMDSLRGRLHELKKESIRKSIARLLLEIEIDDDEIIEHAYTLRSQLIHNGEPDDLDTDLENEYNKTSGVLRNIYAKLFCKKLYHENVG